MPDLPGAIPIQCGGCGAHFQLSPDGDVGGAACSECGGTRFFRSQPSPTQSDGTLRDMVDSDTQKDMGGNPLGEGTIMGDDGERPQGKRDNYMHSRVGSSVYDEIAMLRQGLPQDVQHRIDDMLGHDSINATLNYLHQVAQPPPQQKYDSGAWEELRPVSQVQTVGKRVERMRTFNMEPYAPLWDESYLPPKTTGFAAPLAEGAGALMSRALPTLMKGALGRGVGMGMAEGLMGGGGQQAGGMAPEQPDPAPSMGMLSSTDIPFVLLADYDTPHSVKSVGEQHDDPEKQDQKEFNDGDQSPKNLKNPNLDDSGADGEDGVRDATEGYGIGANSPSVERAMMILPLLLHYFHSDESGQSDPLIRALHDSLEKESPGYLESEDPEGQKYTELVIQQHGKQPPHGMHAANTPWDAVRQRYEGRPDWELPTEGTMMPGEQQNIGTHWTPEGMDDFYEGPEIRDNQMGGYIAPNLTLPPVFPKQVGLGPTRHGGVNAFTGQLPATPMPGNGMQSPGGGTCPSCGGVLAGDGSCPQCGAKQHPQGGMDTQMPTGMGGGMGGGMGAGATNNASYPPNRVGTSGAGPQTPEQKAAVVQLLQHQGREGDIPLVELEPWRFAQELAEIQGQKNVAPLVDPSQAQPTPAPMSPMMTAPGAMPMPDPTQAGGGMGQPMQPMARTADTLPTDTQGWHHWDPNVDAVPDDVFGTGACPRCHQQSLSTAGICHHCGYKIGDEGDMLGYSEAEPTGIMTLRHGEDPSQSYGAPHWGAYPMDPQEYFEDERPGFDPEGYLRGPVVPNPGSAGPELLPQELGWNHEGVEAPGQITPNELRDYSEVGYPFDKGRPGLWGGEQKPVRYVPDQGKMGPVHQGKQADANNVVPRCPLCNSATTSYTDGVDGDGGHKGRCHSCQHIFPLSEKKSRVVLTDLVNPVLQNAAERHEKRPEGNQDSTLTWQDTNGQPLIEGGTYELQTPGYQVPEEVQVVGPPKPEQLNLKLVGNPAGMPGMEDSQAPDFSISPHEMEMYKYQFKPSTEPDSTDGTQATPMGGMPGLEQIPQTPQTTDELSSSYPNPGTVSSILASDQVEDRDDICHKCGCDWITHTASSETTTMHECARCGTAWDTRDEWSGREARTDLGWLNEDSQGDDFHSEMERARGMRDYSQQSRNLSAVVAKDQRLQAVRDVLSHNKSERERTAGRHFTPSEQRALVNERGTARNLEDLDLSNTHYTTRYDQTGKANGLNVPESHLLLGM